MYLKRLDLYGFKSFAGRTSFEFGQGVTAIVGPNGSGKSNIADALRWVLGEQSGKLLRAKRLDDIIFAGSAKRTAAERVEVTLVLDNSDGWLPVPAEEVAICRRGQRNGDSDYFVNGKKTRLRELQAILMKANATQNSYAIIGQGLVESVLNLRAEERRQLIEEAADIQRYRLKIQEAEDRLAQTRENVERVRLLMKEIAPRMNRLERQARLAGEHSRIQRELMSALRAYYEHQWHRGQEALTVARAGYDQAQAEFTQAKVAVETCQRELADVSAQLEEHRQAAAAAAAERDRLDQRVRELDRRVAVSIERRAILQERQRELKGELAALEGERRRAAGILAGEETRRHNLQAKVVEAQQEYERRQAALLKLEEEFRAAVGHAGDAEAKGRRLQAAAAEIKARLRKMADAQRDLERESARLDVRRRSLVNQMAEHLRVLRGLREQEEQLAAEVSRTGARRQALEGEVVQVREALAKIEADQNARRGKLEGLQARLTVLSEAQKQAQGPQQEVVISLEGALCRVYEIIRVPRGLEEAIAAALADQLEAFVFEHQGAAIDALQALVNERGPRTTVLPLDGIKQTYPLNVIREKGVIGAAVRLIKYNQRYEKLVNLLLGRTIVVQDAGVARRLTRRGLGTIVTLDGIVFHPTGQITGGQPQASRPFVLGYERDMESIPKEIERVERSLLAAEREAQALRESLRGLETALSSLNREAEESLDRRLRLQDTMGQRQQKLAQLRGEMRGIIGSQASLREQQLVLAREAERLEQERESMLAESRDSAEAAKHLDRANELFRDRRQALQEAMHEAADALARVDGEYRSLAVQRETAEAALSRLEAQSSAKDVQLRGLDMEVGTLEASIEADEKEMAQARARLEEFLRAMQPGVEGVHHLEARERDLHTQVLSAQGRLFEAERRLLESEADVRRWETEIETLRKRIAEDGLLLTPDGSVVEEGQATEPRIPYWLAAEGQEEGPGGLRPISGGAPIDAEAMEREIERLRGQLRSIGPVNVEAQADYESLRDRYEFLSGQVRDLEAAEESLRRAIAELTGLMRRRFEATFVQVAAGFEQYFHTFFGGGHAKLKLSNPKDPSASGVEIEARPPGKRTHSLTQLSGGEKALTAVSLLFALLQANPSPFCVLDEVDAMLDEANVGRFANALRELSTRTQFIVITHNRRTIEIADNIYGVSMAPDGASRVLSMRLADIPAAEDASAN